MKTESIAQSVCWTILVLFDWISFFLLVLLLPFAKNETTTKIYFIQTSIWCFLTQKSQVYSFQRLFTMKFNIQYISKFAVFYIINNNGTNIFSWWQHYACMGAWIFLNEWHTRIFILWLSLRVWLCVDAHVCICIYENVYIRQGNQFFLSSAFDTIIRSSIV